MQGGVGVGGGGCCEVAVEEWSGETRDRSPEMQVLAVERRRVVGGSYWEEEVLVVVAGGEHSGGGIDARKMRSKSDADYML